MATELTLADKIKLYLEARGWKFEEYQIAGEGRCYADRSGKFVLKSRIVYTRDSKQMALGFRKDAATNGPISLDEATRRLLYTYLKHQGVFACQRCGGAGGAQKWPGWTCYDCGGDGMDHRVNYEKELDRALKGEDFCADYIAKREAKLKKQREDAEKAQQERKEAMAAYAKQRQAEDAGLIAEARSIIGLVSKADAQKIRDYALGVEHYTEGYSMPDDMARRQLVQLVEFTKKRAAEGANLAHVGTVGERIDITATIVFQKDFPGGFHGGTRTLTVLKDDAGNVLKYWNNITLKDDSGWASKGDKVTFKATVKEHGQYQGVKETVLARAGKAVKA